jgi:integrase
MANQVASIVINANLTGIGWRRGKVVMGRNGQPKPGVMLYGGVEVEAPGAYYQIRHMDAKKGGKLSYVKVGSYEEAGALLSRMLKSKQRDYLNAELGDGVVAAEKPEPVRVKRLAEYREAFVDKYAHGSADTEYAYRYISTEFIKLMTGRGKAVPADLTEDDVIAFDRYLESRGNKKYTRATRYGYVRCFLKFVGLDPKKVISDEEHKKLKAKPKLAVKTYAESELQALYAASSDYHRLTWRCYRMLGFRDEELAFLEWENIDFINAIAMVRFRDKGSYPWNRNLAWKSKDSEERDVPVPAVLLAELKAWRQQHPTTRFVVGTRQDRPNIKFLKSLKSDWRRAGLNCGKCPGCNRKVNECQKAMLKTFRSTYLTTMLGAKGLNSRDVQALAGHSSLETTERYLRPAGGVKLQAAVNDVFADAA